MTKNELRKQFKEQLKNSTFSYMEMAAAYADLLAAVATLDSDPEAAEVVQDHINSMTAGIDI